MIESILFKSVIVGSMLFMVISCIPKRRRKRNRKQREHLAKGRVLY